MATGASQCLFLFFLSLLIACSSGASPSVDFEHTDLERIKEHIFHLSRKDLLNYLPTFQTINHELINDPSVPTTPVTNPVTTPVTNPVTTPATNPVTTPSNLPPGIVTVPATTPSVQTPNPNPSPLAVPSTNPIPNPNPVNTPVPVTNPVTTPSTNPVTGSPTPVGGVPVTTPVTPPAATNAPASSGQSWCVARSGAPESSLQSALDYACGIGSVDCSAIQQSGSCYNPNSLQNHASYAFNSYYQKNPVPTSCDFGGTAMITNTNPSSGSCVYPTSGSSSSSSPVTQSPNPASTTPSAPTTTPTTPTPSTTSSSGTGVPVSGTLPTVLNTSNPASGEMPGLGDGTSPLANTSTTSMSRVPQPFVGCIFLVASFCIGTLVLKI